jgi:hypothetical protein
VLPLLAIGIGAMIGGTALDVFGKVKAGKQAKKIGEFNAKVAEAQADDAEERGRFEEDRFRTQLKVLKGKNRAGYAGQSVKVDTGSAVDVAADIDFLGEIDAQTIRANAAREAWGHRVQAQNSLMGASQAATQAYFGAGASILGGAGSLALTAYGMRNPAATQASLPAGQSQAGLRTAAGLRA